MKYAVFLVILNMQPADTDSPDMWWAIDGNMTLVECETKAKEMEPHRAALFGNAAATRLECARDHAPNEW